MTSSANESVPTRLIEDALMRVLACRDFRSSGRKRRFLQFIVQETLAGHADRIKAYALAIDVFDRDASFDPLTDPVVRIEAGRLRRCLERYYLTDGAADPIRITIPKGGYVPQFIRIEDAGSDPLHGLEGDDRDGGAPVNDRGPAVDRAAAARLEETAVPASGMVSATDAASSPLAPLRLWLQRRWAAAGLLCGALWIASLLLAAPLLQAPAADRRPDGGTAAAARAPSLLVLPFTTDDAAQGILADGFTEELVEGLTPVRDLFTLGADTSFRYRSGSDLRQAHPDLALDYLLRGDISRSGDRIQVRVALLRAADARPLWADSFRRDFAPRELGELRQDIVRQVAQALNRTDGMSRGTAGHDTGTTGAEARSSYDCMLWTRHYWRQPDAELHRRSRDCLERTIAIDPHYAEAWAALALVYIDEARLGFNRDAARANPIEAALRLARHAIVLAPDDPFSHQALGLAHWLRRETSLSIEAYEQARALGPQDSGMLAALGRCYSFSGDWKTGIPLVREAFARNPALPGWHRFSLVLFHYVHGRYDEALAEAEKIDRPDLVYTHVALAMIHAQAGRPEAAAREVGEIRRLDPAFAEKAAADFERRNIDPSTIAKMVDGLLKAGLAVTPSGEGISEGL